MTGSSNIQVPENLLKTFRITSSPINASAVILGVNRFFEGFQHLVTNKEYTARATELANAVLPNLTANDIQATGPEALGTFMERVPEAVILAAAKNPTFKQAVTPQAARYAISHGIPETGARWNNIDYYFDLMKHAITEGLVQPKSYARSIGYVIGAEQRKWAARHDISLPIDFDRIEVGNAMQNLDNRKQDYTLENLAKVNPLLARMVDILLLPELHDTLVHNYRLDQEMVGTNRIRALPDEAWTAIETFGGARAEVFLQEAKQGVAKVRSFKQFPPSMAIVTFNGSGAATPTPQS